jgi:acylphosphatase
MDRSSDHPVREPAARLDATIRGRVQGVGFRYFVLREALDLGLDGWVANERDGSVRCVAEGARPSLEALLRELWTGPTGSRVDGVEHTWSRATSGLGRFTVRSGHHGGD